MIQVRASLPSQHDSLPFLSFPHTPLHPPKTHTHKVMPREARHLVPFLLSFTSSVRLCMSYFCPAWCNISVSDTRCNTSVNSCSLLLWAMLWRKAKLQGAETDSRGAAHLLPSEPLFGYETLLSGISALIPNEQSKHKYTCTVNTFTHCWFAITDIHSCSKMALAMHKAKQQFSLRKGSLLCGTWPQLPWEAQEFREFFFVVVVLKKLYK